ncbi:MAG: GNAT family N-acetyltransferase [Rhodobacteraceae bacterium]|jgi:ribosomal protein S18 acetylase RimI-like enzyme|nr:GNAT family N-acetyltransferase [Paracoccaceae bacterium]
MKPELTTEQLTLRPARRDDADDLARLVDMAGEGLPRRFWRDMAAPGADLWAFGAARAARDEGAFSWRNAHLAESDGEVAGGLVTYRVAEVPEPLDGLPPAVRPLQALENRVPGTQYVNVLAVYRAFRGRGIGRALLALAAASAGPAGLSIIVADRNRPALALYLSEGYREMARLPIVRPEGWDCDSTDWVLLTRGRAE